MCSGETAEKQPGAGRSLSLVGKTLTNTPLLEKENVLQLPPPLLLLVELLPLQQQQQQRESGLIIHALCACTGAPTRATAMAQMAVRA